MQWLWQLTHYEEVVAWRYAMRSALSFFFFNPANTIFVPEQGIYITQYNITCGRRIYLGYISWGLWGTRPRCPGPRWRPCPCWPGCRRNQQPVQSVCPRLRGGLVPACVYHQPPQCDTGHRPSWRSSYRYQRSWFIWKVLKLSNLSVWDFEMHQVWWITFSQIILLSYVRESATLDLLLS